MRLSRPYAVCILVLVTLLLAGCKDDADSFFSGRPSEMSMVHNLIIGGPPKAMIELLRVPSRFPDANEAKISHWQGSVIAWWMNGEKHGLLVDSFTRISRHEMHELRVWLRVKDKFQTEANSRTLSEIDAALDALPKSP